MAAAPKLLPVTVISGFLGGGKTTLLQHILRNKEGLRCAVLVNDMAEVNVDANLANRVIQREERIVQMQNGCICCTLREDLLAEVANLAKEGVFDYLVVESTGIAEPMQVAETFTFDSESVGVKSLSDVARLDTCVTVVDAANFMNHWASASTVAEQEKKRDANAETAQEDDRNIADLLVDQIEFADVILLNKIDLVSEQTKNQVLAIIKQFNPSAKIFPTVKSEIAISEVINTGLFSFEKAASNAGWLQEIRGTHKPETIEYGVGSFVYRARRPFHPQRLFDFATKYFLVDARTKDEVENAKAQEGEEGEEEHDHDHDHDHEHEEEEEQLTEEEKAAKRKEEEEAETWKSQQRDERLAKGKAAFGQILRSKGTIWIAHSPHVSGDWSQAGPIATISSGVNWFADQPEDSWPEDTVDAIKADFEEPFGDRRQEIVIIGVELKKEEIVAALNECLLSEEELKNCEDMEMWPETFQGPLAEFEAHGDDEEEEEGEEGEEEEGDE